MTRKEFFVPCKLCVFYVPSHPTSYDGLCHRHPPSLNTQGDTCWPYVEGEGRFSGCGDGLSLKDARAKKEPKP